MGHDWIQSHKNEMSAEKQLEQLRKEVMASLEDTVDNIFSMDNKALFMQTSYNFSIIKLSLLEISYLVMSSVVHIIWVSGMGIGMYF